MICIVYPQGKIGDLIWHEPFFRFISKIENQKIILITRSSTQADKLLSESKYIENFIFNDFKKGFFNYFIEIYKMKKIFIDRKVTKIWILDKVSRPAIAAKLANIKNIIGYGAGNQKFWITNKNYLQKNDLKKHYIERGKVFFKKMNYNFEYTSPKTYVSPTIVNLVKSKINTNKPIISYGIDSSEKHRMWSSENFAKLIMHIDKNNKFHHAIIGSPSNKKLCMEIVNKVKTGVSILEYSSYSIEEICGLLKISVFFIGNDSGPYNLSASVEKYSIGILGNTKSNNNSEYFIPVFPKTGELKALSDRRLDHKGREIKDIKFMNSISVLDVLKKANEVIEKLDLN